MMKKWGIFVVGGLVALAVLMSAPQTTHFSMPLYAQQPQQIAVPQPMTILPWLHVEVETNWAWFWQVSKGRAWVTISQKDTTRITVETLCLQLAAHDTTLSCEHNVSEIALKEKKRGVDIRKRTAIVSAWTENPTVDTVTVSMKP